MDGQSTRSYYTAQETIFNFLVVVQLFDILNKPQWERKKIIKIKIKVIGVFFGEAAVSIWQSILIQLLGVEVEKVGTWVSVKGAGKLQP